MRKHRKIMYTVIVILLLLSLFTACGQQESNLPSLPVPSVKPTESQGTINKNLPNADKSTQDGRLVRTDADGIVSVAIQNGEASIHFDRERWNETRGPSYGEDIFFIPDTMPDAFYPIKVESGGVVDACIAKLPALEPDLSADNFVLSAVVLILDDGSIEWFYANPNGVFVPDGESEPNYIIETFGKMPYRDEFESLSYESTGEGHGESTIYITNAFGDKFDFLYLYLEEQLHYGFWVCELSSDSVKGYLAIGENGDTIFRVGMEDSGGLYLAETLEVWEGTANFIKSPGQHLPLGTLEFDMELVARLYDENPDLPIEIHGSYRAEIMLTEDGTLRLYHNDGDELYPSDGNHTALVFELLSEEFYFDDGIEGPAHEEYAFIRFGRTQNYGWPVLEIDFVEWIDDENEPNDYRIENEPAGWVPYGTMDSTQCAILSYETMELEEMSVFEFAEKLKNGELYEFDEGFILATVTVAEDTITSIRQVYTP